MQTQAFLDEPQQQDGFQLADRPLRVVIAYNEITAGKRAMRVMTNLGREWGEEVDFLPFPWSFGLLADTEWGEVAASDAVRADILIIATSSTNPLPPAVGRWTTTAISRKQGTAAAVIALFGSEDNPDGADSSRLGMIQNAARDAGLAFFAPTAHDQPVALQPSRQTMLAESISWSAPVEPSAVKVVRQKVPVSFRDEFCLTNRCAPDQFTDRVFLLTLYFHALPVALILWPWRRRLFAADHAMIEKVGGAQWRGDVRWKLNQMRTSEWLGGPGRRLLRCRISTQRLGELMAKVMHGREMAAPNLEEAAPLQQPPPRTTPNS